MTNTTNVIKVGVMPGRIQEVAVEVGTPISTVLELAGLTSEGYEIKVDGVTSSATAVTTSSTQLILLTKQVKGNAVVKVGIMPGRIQEVAVEESSTIGQALELAGLSPEGYEIKVDGVTKTTSDLVGSASLILLTKQVKGNGLVKVGVMPGRIQEVAVEETSTIADALELAGLTAEGYEIKVDGVTKQATDVVGSAQLILLTKQVKGNKRRDNDSDAPIIIVD